MVKVIAKNFILPEHVSTAKSLFQELISATRQENGCIAYRLFLNTQDPSEYTFIEEWASQEALDRHINTTHFQTLLPQIGQLAAKPGEISVYTEFGAP
ncbi:MAG: antibiotic biosynthesis monooxygenase [Peptococcaceae bacterium]|jgi:quinol monooxygenase YgiN|nr:antibiotic biosynthesis monooxygenase [Peptococcaceae bacterium]